MTSRPPVAAGLTPSKPNSPTFSASNESVDHANRIALVNPVIEAFRQQRRLRPNRPCNEALHQIPPQNHQENLSSTLALLGSVAEGLGEAVKQWSWNFHHVSWFPGH